MIKWKKIDATRPNLKSSQALIKAKYFGGKINIFVLVNVDFGYVSDFIDHRMLLNIHGCLLQSTIVHLGTHLRTNSEQKKARV